MSHSSHLSTLAFNLPLLHHIAPGAELTIVGRWKDSPHKHKLKLKGLPNGIVAGVWSDPSGARYDLTFDTRTHEMLTPAARLIGHEVEEGLHAMMLLQHAEQLVRMVSPPGEAGMY